MHRVPPEGLDERYDIPWAVQDPHAGSICELRGQVPLEQRNPRRTGDEEGDRQEALDDDLNVWFDADHVELARCRCERGWLVVAHHPGHMSEFVEGHGVADIVQAINLIADRTNLLSLNASIEAARAG